MKGYSRKKKIHKLIIENGNKKIDLMTSILVKLRVYGGKVN